MFLLLLFVFVTIGFANEHAKRDDGSCGFACGGAYPMIVQTIPVGMTVNHTHNTTVDAWVDTINGAQYNISIAAFYITLTQGAKNWPPEAGGANGLAVFNALIKAQQRGVTVKIVVGWPPIDNEGDSDPAALEAAGVIVRKLNWKQSTGLSGVLHTKFMLVDTNTPFTRAYLGSANFDWRSLSQVKELGILLRGCQAITTDLQMIFEQYWYLAAPNKVPSQWNANYWPLFNNRTPMMLNVEGSTVAAWIAESPDSLCPPTRMYDAHAMLEVFSTAEQYVRLSVMEYSPFFIYNSPTTIWPDLDNAIRLAALRGVKISFILGYWIHTQNDTIPYLQSLNVLPNIEVRLLEVPPWTTANGTAIPFTRVDHSKYAISENRYYITTSNWTPDYFLQTAGVSLTMVSSSNNWREMETSFEDDWNSQYTVPLFQKFPPQYKPKTKLAKK